MTMTGGEKLMAELRKIESRLADAGSGPNVKVGFLPGSAYADGTSIPLVAFTNEFGGTISRDASEVTVYRKTNAKGTMFLRNGKFVKKKDSNFSTTHAHDAYTITIPPRPFFRTMIKTNASAWPSDVAKLLKEEDYSAAAVLGKMGELIQFQLKQSIEDLTSPPLAPSTVAKKGFDSPLIDKGIMRDSVDYVVSE